MMKKAWIAAMFGAAVMAASTGALAQKQAETGWYVRGSIGQNDDLDDDFAYSIAAGYQINRNLSVEAGYAFLGGLTVAGVGVEASAWEALGVYKFPLQSNFSVYGMAGLAIVEAETVLPIIGKVSDDSTELTFGFGVQYDFSPKLGVRGQWQRYNTDQELDVLSIGLVYKF